HMMGGHPEDLPAYTDAAQEVGNFHPRRLELLQHLLGRMHQRMTHPGHTSLHQNFLFQGAPFGDNAAAAYLQQLLPENMQNTQYTRAALRRQAETGQPQPVDYYGHLDVPSGSPTLLGHILGLFTGQMQDTASTASTGTGTGHHLAHILPPGMDVF